MIPGTATKKAALVETRNVANDTQQRQCVSCETMERDSDDPFLPVTLPDRAQVRFSRITVILGSNFFSF